jgi:hypothetical protein
MWQVRHGLLRSSGLNCGAANLGGKHDLTSPILKIREFFCKMLRLAISRQLPAMDKGPVFFVVPGKKPRAGEIPDAAVHPMGAMGRAGWLGRWTAANRCSHSAHS